MNNFIRTILMVGLAAVVLTGCKESKLDGRWVIDQDRTILENDIGEDDFETLVVLEMSSQFSHTIDGDNVHVSMKPFEEADCSVKHEGQSVKFEECSIDDLSLIFELYGNHLINRDNGLQYFWKKQIEK